MAPPLPKPSFSKDVFLAYLSGRSLVLVGMMGVGKSSVGRRLAQSLGLDFVDADKEIEKAADRSIIDIFETLGEAHFRDGEKRVIQRLLSDGPQVLATGGGAFMNAETRANISDQGISIWLDADHSVIMGRVRRKPTRPLLQNPNPDKIVADLLAERNPVYAHADIKVMSRDAPHETVVEDILTALVERMEAEHAL